MAIKRETEKSNIEVVTLKPKDVFEQAAALPFWSQNYIQLDKGSFSGSVTSVSNGNMQIFRESMNRAVDQLASAPENCYVIGLPTIVEGEAQWRGHQLRKNSLITLNKNAELLFRTAHTSEICAAVITEERLAQYATEVEQLNLTDLMLNVNPVALIPQHTTNKLLSALFIGTEYMSKNIETIDVNRVWRHLEDNLLSACLQSLIEANKLEVRNYENRVHRHVVNRVKNLTLSITVEPITISEICIELNISRRTLNHAFCKVLGITPVAYMRNIRLHRIRSEFQESPEKVMSIAHTASKWGFWHMSLFARYYRELFGECPSETLEKAKNRR